MSRHQVENIFTTMSAYIPTPIPISDNKPTDYEPRKIKDSFGGRYF